MEQRPRGTAQEPRPAAGCPGSDAWPTARELRHFPSRESCKSSVPVGILHTSLVTETTQQPFLKHTSYLRACNGKVQITDSFRCQLCDRAKEQTTNPNRSSNSLHKEPQIRHVSSQGLARHAESVLKCLHTRTRPSSLRDLLQTDCSSSDHFGKFFLINKQQRFFSNCFKKKPETPKAYQPCSLFEI